MKNVSAQLVCLVLLFALRSSKTKKMNVRLMNNKQCKVLVKRWNRIRDDTCFSLFSHILCLTHFLVAVFFFFEVLKGMDLGLFHVFVCVCFYFVCMLYMLGIVIPLFTVTVNVS